MIEFLKQWCINIVVMSVFITIIEILLPNSNMKRYINIVIGLLVIIVIINPFIKLITNDIDIEKEVFSNIIEYNEKDDFNEKELSEIHNEQIINTYKQKLSMQIRNTIDKETEYQVKEVYVQIEEDKNNDDFGKIENIVLSLTQRNSTKTNNSNIKIDEVSVGVNINNNYQKVYEKNNKRIDEVKNLISNCYGLRKDNVIVNFNEQEL